MENNKNTGQPPDDEPRQIGEIIHELDGPEGVAGAELPTGQTEADQHLASLEADIEQILAGRTELVERIHEAGPNSNPKLLEELDITGQALLEAYGQLIQARQNISKT